MPSSTKFVGTGVNDTQYGTQSWGNPANILADDATVARFTNTTAGTISNYLKGTNCGFAIPAGATIDGIVVEIERHSSVGTTKDNRVRIVKADGSIGTTDKADLANNWETVVTIKSYGGPTDLWGESWTPADINNSNFGVVLSAETIVQNRGDVDFIRITVHYTEAGVSGAAQVSWAEFEVPDAPADGGAQVSWAELEVPDVQIYRNAVLGINPIAYWRLGEQAGTTASDELGNHHGSYQGGPTLGVSPGAVGDADTAVGFDGVNDSVIIPHHANLNFGTGAFSVVVWFRRIGVPTQTRVLVGKQSLGLDPGWRLQADAFSNLDFITRAASSTTLSVSGVGSYFDGEWHQLVAVRDGTALRMYVDGALIGSTTGTLRDVNNTAPIETRMETLWWSGDLDEPAVWNRALTAVEIADLFTAAGGTPPADGGAQVSWAELEVPDAPVAVDGAAQISWAEFEVPDEPPPPPVVFEPHVEYQIVITDLAGNILGEIPAKNLQFAYTMNDAGSMTFVLPLQHPKATKALLDPGKRRIFIYRNANLVWGGDFWMVTATTGEATVRSFGEEWFSRLKRRFVDTGSLEYVNVDQFDIAWNLIDFTQTKANGSLGITRFSTTPSGVLRTQSFHGFERPNIGEVLLSMTELSDGFDFEVTPDRQWKTYYPKRGVPYSTSGLTFELGKNLDTISYDEDATNTAGEISALGGGEGLARCIAVASDATSLADFGLLQDVIADSDVKSFPTLLAMAQEELRIRKVRRNQPQISTSTFPPFGSYAVGDEARVKAEKGFIEIDRVFRIVAINVQITDEGREVVGVFFDEALL